MKTPNGAVNVRRMCQLALFIAVELVMKILGLGSVPVGPLNMSFLTVPVALGAMLMGPAAGAIMGAIFGLCSFYDALSGASVMTGIFLQISPIHTFILCVVTRTLMGLCTGLLFKALHTVDKKITWSCVAGALAAPLLNTLFFMGYIVLVFYGSEYIQNLVTKLNAPNPLMFVVLLVGMQGLIEAVVCGVVGGAVTKAVSKIIK